MSNNHSSLILNHLYGLHSFAFYILIFDFSLQPLTPDPWPLTPNVIVHKYLRAEKLLYNCRELSTSVESSLQINLFMQNKANFRKVKLNINKVLTRNYVQMDTWSIRKTKPIQSQSKPIKANSKPIKANKMPKQTQFKPKLVRHQCGGQTQCLPAVPFGGLVRHLCGGSNPKKLSMLLSIMIFAAAIIFSKFGVLGLTTGQKSRILPLLYFPVVLNRLFEGIS
jgi:hypothetical protein